MIHLNVPFWNQQISATWTQTTITSTVVCLYVAGHNLFQTVLKLLLDDATILTLWCENAFHYALIIPSKTLLAASYLRRLIKAQMMVVNLKTRFEHYNLEVLLIIGRQRLRSTAIVREKSKLTCSTPTTWGASRRFCTTRRSIRWLWIRMTSRSGSRHRIPHLDWPARQLSKSKV